MGNCCGSPSSATIESGHGKPKNKNNPFHSNEANGSGAGFKLSVLKDPTGHDISSQYDLGREVGRGEFGVTYLCTDIQTGDKYACKSISKKKLRTAVDIGDVRREVEIMRHMPKHPNIVSLKDSFEDDDAVHIVMELCEGGELFDRIVARGHYTERAAAAVMKTIVEVVQVLLITALHLSVFYVHTHILLCVCLLQICHKQGVMHRDLKPENFLFANKKETSALKAIDFGLSVFFKPGTFDEYQWEDYVYLYF